ncbi:hypothetical protein LSH36_127g12005 [Paralvinella palmiformis]|uniref:Uncharacterized protein n=1 Tax=Paralvinella palmiformis TaxID=53620 RepID=A0AAD9JXN3_9ANNE|nr:hypothetical protein LSH36_127g12005 [Paralvinella palmiformis]
MYSFVCLKFNFFYARKDAVATIHKKEGISALWSGTVPSIILATNPAVQFMVYEALKRRIQGQGKQKNLASLTYFAMGAVSKMAATIVTYPLQVVQARSRVSIKTNVLAMLLNNK